MSTVPTSHNGRALRVAKDNFGGLPKRLALTLGALCLLFLCYAVFGPMNILDDAIYLELRIEGDGATHPPPGTYRHPLGRATYLTAAPAADSGHGFVGWRGDVHGDAYEINFEMDRHKEVVAVFAPPEETDKNYHEALVVVAGARAGQVEPPQGRYYLRDGESRSFKALTGPDAFFNGWQLVETDGANTPVLSALLCQPQITLEMTASRTAFAWFEDSGRVLTLEKTGPGTLLWPPGAYALAMGASVHIIAFPEEGYRLRHWEDERGEVVYAPGPLESADLCIEVASDMTRRAVFEKAVRTLTVIHEGPASGRTTPGGAREGATHVLPYGEVVTIEAHLPDEAVAFGGWEGDVPESLSRAALLMPTLEACMTKDRRIVARFVNAETTLILDALVNGRQDTGVAATVSPEPGRYGFVRDRDAVVAIEAPWTSAVPFAFVG